jgi:hypothetical protein|tara:strand:+ start:335 stop:2737 length:2403 start_codon:yes stop_codon:yes gene_type:complete
MPYWLSLLFVNINKNIYLCSLFCVLLSGSNPVFSQTNTELYEEIFGIDNTNQPDSQPEELITSLIIFGVQKTTLVVNINQYSEVISFESTPFIEHISSYLKPEILQELKQLATEKFIQNNLLPSGIEVRLNNILALEVSIDKNSLISISPTLNLKPFNTRKPFDVPILSSVHDVDITFIQKANAEHVQKAVVDTTLRFNRALLSGSSSYYNQVSNFFNENWIAQYEDTNKSFFYGYLQSPSFANLNPNKLSRGFAIGNTDLQDNIAFSRDAKYIDLVYPATIEIYIDNILYQRRDFPAGRHRLNIPLQNRLLEIRIEVKDIYGREQSYDFSSYSGSNTIEDIPLKNNYSYFTSYGKNDELKMQFYGGIEFGLSDLSKAQIAINQVSSNIVIAGKYYKIMPLGAVSSIITLNHDWNKDNGYGLMTESLLNLSSKLSLNLSHIYENNLDANVGNVQNKHSLGIRVSYFSNKMALNANLDYNIKQRTSAYRLIVNYQLNKAMTLNFSYNTPRSSESYSSVNFFSYNAPPKSASYSSLNFNYKFGRAGKSSVSSGYRDDTKKSQFNLAYDMNDQNIILFENSADRTNLKHQYKGDIFNTNIALEQPTNSEEFFEINTKFSIVSAEDLVSIAPVGSQNNGFIIMEASEQFIGELGVRSQSTNCKLKRLQRCILFLPPEQQLNLNYQQELIPLGVSIDPPKISIRVPRRGGVKQYLSSKVSYFVEGVLVDKSSKPIKLRLGAVGDKDSLEVDTFTDEDGLFFIELAEGEYTLTMPGYQSIDFNVNKEELIDSVINIGTIQLQKLSQ